MLKTNESNKAFRGRTSGTDPDVFCWVKSKMNTLCHANICAKPKTERVQEDGTCAACSEYSKPSADRRSCKEPKCNQRQKLTKAGICEYCSPYTRADGKYSCKAKPCRPRAKLLMDGTCADCPPFSVVSANGRYCYERACGKR